jgi:cation:H+ antiporter
MANELFLLLVGILGLWLGASLAVKSMENIAGYFRISGLFIGLTIASIGTSIPEIAVSITGALDRLGGLETSGLVIGDIIGSALNQITLLVGIVAFFGILKITKREWRRDGSMLLASVGLVFLILLDGIVTRSEGVLMIVVYLLYFFNLIREEKVYSKVQGKRPEVHIFWDIMYMVSGLLLVFLSANFVVLNGEILATTLGVSDALIGIFIIGLGTGLPELAISLYAFKSREYGISVGNLIGSNIADLLLSFGAGAAISGFIVDRAFIAIDLPVLFAVTIFMLFLFRTDFTLKKKEGLFLIASFLVYAAAKILMA